MIKDYFRPLNIFVLIFEKEEKTGKIVSSFYFES